MPRLSEERWKTLPDGSQVRNVPHAATSSAGDEPVAEDAYDDLTKEELQAELEARDLPTSGNKAELVARLQESDS